MAITKAQIENYKANGIHGERILAAEVERLNKLVNKWRNRVPADERAKYAGKVPEVKHRWHLFFDGRSHEWVKRNEREVTCPDGLRCTFCFPENPFA